MKNYYIVSSMTDHHRYYPVRIKHVADGLRVLCSCEHARHNGEGCVHAIAVLNSLAKVHNKRLSFWNSEEDAKSQKHRITRVGENIWATSQKRKVVSNEPR